MQLRNSYFESARAMVREKNRNARIECTRYYLGTLLRGFEGQYFIAALSCA
jgi:hypothetical protein